MLRLAHQTAAATVPLPVVVVRDENLAGGIADDVIPADQQTGAIFELKLDEPAVGGGKREPREDGTGCGQRGVAAGEDFLAVRLVAAGGVAAITQVDNGQMPVDVARPVE